MFFFFSIFLSFSSFLYSIFIAAENLTDFQILQNGLDTTITQTHRPPPSNGGVLFLFKAVLSNVFHPFYTN